MHIAVDSLSSVSEAHAWAPAAANQGTRNVHIAVASTREHSRVLTVGCHAAQVSMAEAACGLRAVAASPGLACEMGFTYVVVPEPWLCTVSVGAPVARADVWKGVLLGPGSLGRAASGAALPVESTVTVGRVSRVDAEGSGLVPRGLACVFLAVGRVDPLPLDGVVDVFPVTAHDPASPAAAAADGHRIGSPWRSGTRHKGVYNLDVLGHFDRWRVEVGVVVGQQCLSV